MFENQHPYRTLLRREFGVDTFAIDMVDEEPKLQWSEKVAGDRPRQP